MLKINQITKKFSEFSLEDVNFHVNKGECAAILGPSGSGKTILMEIIARHTQTNFGEIIFKWKGYFPYKS